MKRFPHPVLACLAACCAVVLCAQAAAARQSVGRLNGTVKSLVGQPIKAATIRAVNPSAVPNEFTATSDEKGNWSILGVRGGLWEVTAIAPGFESSTVVVRAVTSMRNPAIQFVLVGTPVRGAMDGVDTERLQASLDAAEALMVQEQWDAAVREYRGILEMAPALDTVQFAIGRALRMKKDFAGAEAAYGEVLKRDDRNQKALLELGRTQYEQGDRVAAIATLERLVAIDGATDEARDARAALDEIRK